MLNVDFESKEQDHDRVASSCNFAFVTALHGHSHKSRTASGRPRATWKSNSAWTAVVGRVHYGDVNRSPLRSYNKE